MSNQPYPSLVFVDSLEPASTRDSVESQSHRVRSHAISNALARQRRRAQEKGENFRAFAPHATRRTRECGRADHMNMVVEATTPSGYLGKASVDPFETLSVNARRLTTLFHEKESARAGEPVFNVNDAIHYQTMHSVFNTGLTDGALTPALGLTMQFAAAGQMLDHECIAFNSIALQEIRKKVSDPIAATIPATIGSILLLLGIEYRLSARRQAEAHLKGIQALLQLCARRNVIIPEPLRRAIYWQDLFSSVFVQTDRIVHYSDFHPGKHSPVLDLSALNHTPEGFAQRTARLGLPFIHVVSDVAALYHAQSDWTDLKGENQDLERLCNTQAILEGRLHELRQSTSDNLLISCTIAAFLCVYAFWTDVWNTALMPRGLSRQLLYHLRCWQGSESQHDDGLLCWLVYVGKAFAIDAHVRRGLDEICNGGQKVLPNSQQSWSKTRAILHSFIWSETFYHPEVGWFWQHINDGK